MAGTMAAHKPDCTCDGCQAGRPGEYRAPEAGYAEVLAHPGYGPYTAHEAADLFPLMTEDEFAGLVDDIRANGQMQAAEVMAGQIVDGRNRYLAAKAAGKTPRIIETPVTDPWAYVVSKNLHRRHLTGEQRDQVIVKLRERGHGIEQIARETGVPKSTVGDVVQRAADVSESGNVPKTRTDARGRNQPTSKKSRKKRKADAAKQRHARQEPTEGIKVNDDQVVDAEVVEPEEAPDPETARALGVLQDAGLTAREPEPLEERGPGEDALLDAWEEFTGALPDSVHRLRGVFQLHGHGDPQPGREADYQAAIQGPGKVVHAV